MNDPLAVVATLVLLVVAAVCVAWLITDFVFERWVRPWAWRKFAEKRGVDEAELRQYLKDLREDR